MNREEIMQKLKTYEEHEIFYREYGSVAKF